MPIQQAEDEMEISFILFQLNLDTQHIYAVNWILDTHQGVVQLLPCRWSHYSISYSQYLAATPLPVLSTFDAHPITHHYGKVHSFKRAQA